jgi:hypothetical protein
MISGIGGEGNANLLRDRTALRIGCTIDDRCVPVPDLGFDLVVVDVHRDSVYLVCIFKNGQL